MHVVPVIRYLPGVADQAASENGADVEADAELVFLLTVQHHQLKAKQQSAEYYSDQAFFYHYCLYHSLNVPLNYPFNLLI